MQKVSRVIFFLVLSICLFPGNLQNTTKAASNASNYPDVSDYSEEIDFLSDLGIITGYKNGHFGPNDSIKRIQAVQMILRELKIPLGDAPNPNFKDIMPGSYGYEEIAKAAELNIISGKENGNFDPFGILTRGQMAKILVKAYELKGIYYHDFTDVRYDSSMYPYIEALAAHRITTGYPDGSFRPNEALKRSHFAVFLARMLNDNFKLYDDTKAKSIQEIVVNEQSVVTIEIYDENDEMISLGSGFIVSNQLIATNFHVISGGTRAVAVTATGEEYVLDGVVAYNEYTDIAVLKPEKKVGFPALPLASINTVKKGESVVAIGSPLGFQNTVSEGIVSGFQVFEDEYGTIQAIQTTADITFGSSGGPLLNRKGSVIGINTFGFETINFALPTDYLLELLENYIGESFGSIPTEPLVNMPYVEEPVIDEETGQEDEEIISPLPTPSLDEEILSDIFIDIVHDPILPIIYGINDLGELISYNYETMVRRELAFEHPAESIYMENGELYLTLLKSVRSSYANGTGAVAIVNPNSFTTKKQFDINIDPYDIVVDSQHVYVSSGSYQWTYLKSYDKDSGEEVSSQGIRQQSQIELHPGKGRIYAVDSDTSPRDMEVFYISNGIITTGFDSPYHGDFDMAESMTISPDGKYIFNHSGTVFKASPLRSSDMTYVTDIGVEFTSITFSQDGSSFFVLNDNIYEYDYDNFVLKSIYEIEGEASSLFNHNGEYILVGKKKYPYSNVPRTFITKLDI